MSKNNTIPIPQIINNLALNESCVYTLEPGVHLHSLRKSCATLGLMRNCTYYVRKTDDDATFLIQRRVLASSTKVDRSQYPYATMEVGAFFRIPKYQETSENALRVRTTVLGQKLKRKFSIRYDDANQDYIVTRKS